MKRAELEPRAEQRHHHVALGHALAGRAPEILGYCQEKYRQSAGCLPLAVVQRIPTWRITEIATAAIVRWLETGDSASEDVRAEIEELGCTAAIQQHRSTRVASLPNGSEDTGDPPPLSIAMLTKLNFWWGDATCEVLDEEAVRLGTPPAVLAAAQAVVTRSSRASLVGMARRFDAAIESLQAQMSELALHDSLTGLANRSVLIDRLDRSLAGLGHTGSGLALVFIDLDNFKAVNDVHGHACGDAILVEMARRLEANVRPGDLVTRLGGDELVVLFERVARRTTDVELRAERLRAVCADSVAFGQIEVRVTVSAGVAVVQRRGPGSEEVLAEADAAMYRAKRAGRNKVALVEIGEGRPHVRLASTGGLDCALERQELRLEYQPLHDALDGTLTGFEALLRWEHPERGTVPPLEVVPIAEEWGLIVAIGDWVLEEACRQAMEWSGLLGFTPRMAVNVSARQLEDPSYVGRVASVLQRTGMDSEHLVLEITESALLADGFDHEATLSALHERGIRLSIDDFGTGYSALAYLRRFTFDQLKVDQAFVRDVAEHGDTRVMRVVVHLAHELGLEVVAEGVETRNELEMVRRLGCDAVQGFLLGRPVPASCFAIDRHAAAGIVVPA